LINLAAFVACATGPAGGSPDAQCACFDVNLTGTADLLDFAGIQNGFTG